jgi:hypothetical protein
VAHEVETCPHCGSTSPAGANFCPSCGHALAGEPGAVELVSPSPRLFGVLSPVTTFVLGCMLLLGALVAFAASSPIAAIVLLAMAVAVFVLFLGSAERDRSSRVARAALAGKARARGWTSFATGSAGAWAKASRELWRLRSQLRNLRQERQTTLVGLGDAAYREDEPSAASFRERLREIDAEIASLESSRTAALTRARDRVADERVAVHHTEVLPPDAGERPNRTTDA